MGKSAFQNEGNRRRRDGQADQALPLAASALIVIAIDDIGERRSGSSGRVTPARWVPGVTRPRANVRSRAERLADVDYPTRSSTLPDVGLDSTPHSCRR